MLNWKAFTHNQDVFDLLFSARRFPHRLFCSSVFLSAKCPKRWHAEISSFAFRLVCQRERARGSLFIMFAYGYFGWSAFTLTNVTSCRMAFIVVWLPDREDGQRKDVPHGPLTSLEFNEAWAQRHGMMRLWKGTHTDTHTATSAWATPTDGRPVRAQSKRWALPCGSIFTWKIYDAQSWNGILGIRLNNVRPGWNCWPGHQNPWFYQRQRLCAKLHEGQKKKGECLPYSKRLCEWIWMRHGSTEISFPNADNKSQISVCGDMVCILILDLVILLSKGTGSFVIWKSKDLFKAFDVSRVEKNELFFKHLSFGAFNDKYSALTIETDWIMAFVAEPNRGVNLASTSCYTKITTIIKSPFRTNEIK